MLELSKVQHLAETYAPQELFAALVWQRQFNLFDGPQVITALANHPDLWESFLFTKPIFAPDKHGLSFNGVVDTLLAMANYRPMPDASIIHFVQYPADTLYILTENQDAIVAQLMDLGKKWKADEVSAFDGSIEEEEDWKFRNYLSLRLKDGLWGKQSDQDRDAIVVSYWWD
jgi:hypothetical protein